MSTPSSLIPSPTNVAYGLPSYCPLGLQRLDSAVGVLGRLVAEDADFTAATEDWQRWRSDAADGRLAYLTWWLRGILDRHPGAAHYPLPDALADALARAEILSPRGCESREEFRRTEVWSQMDRLHLELDWIARRIRELLAYLQLELPPPTENAGRDAPGEIHTPAENTMAARPPSGLAARPQRGSNPNRKGGGEAEMIKKVRSDPVGTLGWSARKWSIYLKRSKSTIQGYGFWGTLMKRREEEKGESRGLARARSGTKRGRK